MSRRVLFVAGAHTDIGKTHVACALIRMARAEGWRADALKPVASGFDEANWSGSDPGRLLAALGQIAETDRLDALSPFRFAAPVAPPMAAIREGCTLSFDQIVAFCRERIRASDADLMVVEGVGGLMSPIAESATTLDLLEALAGWNLLVGGSYLGAISHTLTALEVMRARGVAPAAIIMSQDGAPDAPDFWESLALVAEHAGATPVIPAPRDEDRRWAGLAFEMAFG